MKQMYIIAGCNGAGKTTASFTVLPIVDSCYIFDSSKNDRELIAKKEFANFVVARADKFGLLKKAML